MCETKGVPVLLSIILLKAVTCCIYQAHTREKLGGHSEIKTQGICEKDYKKYCLNCAESYHLEEIAVFPASTALQSTDSGQPRPPTVGECGPTGIAASWSSHSLR